MPGRRSRRVVENPRILAISEGLTVMSFDKKAIILDLRGNVGGVIGATVGLAGMLTDSQITFLRPSRSVMSPPSSVPTAIENSSTNRYIWAADTSSENLSMRKKV